MLKGVEHRKREEKRMDKELTETLAFRCKPTDRATVRAVSKSLSLAESDVARAALREGLKIIGARGIQRDQEEPR